MRTSTIRLWVATVVTIILVIAVWKFIDFRMQPPPPPNSSEVPTAAP